MESAVPPSMPFVSSSPIAHVHRRSPQSLPLSRTLRSRSPFAKARCLGNLNAPRSGDPLSISFSGNILRGPPRASRVLACISSSAASSGSGGGGLGETEAKSLAGESEEVLGLEAGEIVLSVGGMVCGGCAASVKRILESQPQVSSATVNLEKETAVILVVPEVMVTQNWQQQLGEMFANHLTTCGFKSNLQLQA